MDKGFEPLQITLYLKESVAFYDDYSPDIAGILEYIWLQRKGLFNSNPNPLELIQPDIPLAKIPIADTWYYACSSPHYWYISEDQAGFRKRWDPEGIGLVNWGKKKAHWNSGQSEFKAFNLPLFLRNIFVIKYWVVGHLEEIKDLLGDLISLGKRHNAGWGALADDVKRVVVEPSMKDYHLLGVNNELMRPIPRKYKDLLPRELRAYKAMEFGWKPPARFNRELCLVPSQNVRLGNPLKLEQNSNE